jgi:hypothetical protein
MMGKYEIRTKDGLLVAEVTANAANSIINSCRGFYRAWTSGNGSWKSCYEISQDMKTEHPLMTFYLWSGYVLIPK